MPRGRSFPHVAAEGMDDIAVFPSFEKDGDFGRDFYFLRARVLAFEDEVGAGVALNVEPVQFPSPGEKEGQTVVFLRGFPKKEAGIADETLEGKR